MRVAILALVLLGLMAGEGLGAERPRIGMLWSGAAGVKGKAERAEDMARRAVVVRGADDWGLEWDRAETQGMAEGFTRESVGQARDELGKLLARNPRVVALAEIYFFEAEEKEYPAGSPWWKRDTKGKRQRFWPGCYDMDLGNDEYVRHVANRAIAAVRALDGKGGLFVDNLRFDDVSKRGWTKLLGWVRDACPDAVVVANAGWDSEGLEWVAPMVNGIMYEDSVAHARGKDTEGFYARIAATDRLLREPRVSINERFGKRDDEARMRRELVRTLVYTDMAYLYADSTNGHRHQWWGEWDVTLGKAIGGPVKPERGKAARREFENGVVVWVPEEAVGAERVGVDRGTRVWGNGEVAGEITVAPGTGIVLVRR